MNFFSASTAKEANRTALSGASFKPALPAEQSELSLPSQVLVGVRPEDLAGPAS